MLFRRLLVKNLTFANNELRNSRTDEPPCGRLDCSLDTCRTAEFSRALFAVESEEGIGTSFIVQLPIGPAAPGNDVSLSGKLEAAKVRSLQARDLVETVEEAG